MSVIIPVRNEQTTIRSLLQDLHSQTLPKELYEVIVVDDHSTDHSKLEFEAFCDSLDRPASVHQSFLFKTMPHYLSGKKSAIDYGVSLATGNLIVTTDGDCSVGQRWLESLMWKYESEGGVFISAPVRFGYPQNIWHSLLQLEFATLIGSGASLIRWGLPTLCNGANLLYEKSTFVELEGYSGNQHIASGDDEFLMHKVFKFKGSSAIRFLKDPDAIITTRWPRSFGEWLNQRIRWASKWNSYNHGPSKLIGILVWITNVNILMGLLLAANGNITWSLWASLLATKTFLDFVFIAKINTFLGQKTSLIWVLLSELFYPFYSVSIGLLSLRGSYLWKDRVVSKGSLTKINADDRERVHAS